MDEKQPEGQVCRVTYGEGKYKVEARSQIIGNDLVVAIFGGMAPHVGAVAIAIPRLSLRNPKLTSATSSVFTVMGHKDDIIARREAERLASELKRLVVVVAGIHVDNATNAEIDLLLESSNKCVETLLAQLTSLPSPGAAETV